jgi:molecular chaperone GrpE
MTDDIKKNPLDTEEAIAQPNHEIDLNEEYEGKHGPLDTEEDDITFEQDDTTRENTRPDALAKIAKLKIEIEKLKVEKQQYLDSWQRDKAEFVNARKRDEEAKSEFLKFSNVGFVEELLPVIDSFEAAQKHEDSKEGIGHIYNQFQSTLKKLGVEPFGAIGDAFDPSLHQAIANIEATDKSQDHTVAEVLQKGYSIHGKVIRPAFVKVFQV